MKHSLLVEKRASNSFIPMRAVEVPSALNVAFRLFPIMLAPQGYRLFRKLCQHISRIPTQHVCKAKYYIHSHPPTHLT